jgi:redox-sensitive bicupin YhaK (pirin superfamily)
MSPVKSLSPAYIYELRLPPNTTCELPITSGDSSAVYPLNEPIVSHASFVMNSRDQIQQVIASYQNGEMRQ